MSATAFARRGLDPPLRMGRSRSRCAATAGRRGVDARLRARAAARTRSCGASSGCCTTWTTSASRTSRPAIRARRWRSSRPAATRPRSSAPSPRTPTSSASRATRRWRRRCSRSTSCRGFVLACAYVRPQGLEGMTPKSVKKKLKTAGLRRRGQPRGGPRRGRAARRRLRRAHRVRDRGACRRGRTSWASTGSAGSAGRLPATARPSPRPSRCSTPQNASAIRCSPRWRTSSTRRSPGRRRSGRSGRGRRRARRRATIRARLPVRALDRPRHDVLEAAERRRGARPRARRRGSPRPPRPVLPAPARTEPRSSP